MNIYLKEGYLNYVFSSLNYSSPRIWVPGLCPGSPWLWLDCLWTSWFLSGHCPVHLDYLDIFQSFPGYFQDCPLTALSPWTLSLESLDFVHEYCLVCLEPWTPWTFSRVSLDIFKTVHWLHWVPPWTLSLESLDFVHEYCPVCLEPWTSWTFSRVTLDIVLTVHWVHGKSARSLGKKSRESTILQMGTAQLDFNKF